MNPEIEAIFLDVGNTLRIVIEEPEFMAQAKKDLMTLVGAKGTRRGILRSTGKELESLPQTIQGIPGRSIRNRAMDEMAPAALPLGNRLPPYLKLTRLWRDHDGRRVPRDDAKETILELDRRGYKLGIIANTITETEIPDWMESDGVKEYFRVVVLSSKVGLRKPNPEIYWLAAREMGVDPARCAYLGDNPIRDEEGTRAAGYGMFILFEEPATIAKEPAANVAVKADYTVKTCRELAGYLPAKERSCLIRKISTPFS